MVDTSAKEAHHVWYTERRDSAGSSTEGMDCFCTAVVVEVAAAEKDHFPGSRMFDLVHDPIVDAGVLAM